MRRLFPWLLGGLAMVAQAEAPKVRTVVFDLGEVILALNREAPTRHFRPYLDFGSPPVQAAHRRFERGDITPKGFRDELRALGKIPTTVADLTLDYWWNEELGGFDPQRILFVQKLRQAGYQVAMLSNTNATHAIAIDHNARRDLAGLVPVPGPQRALEAFFSPVLYSFELGTRKPEPRIYQQLFDRLGRPDPATVVFLDDRAENVVSARQAGIQAIEIAIGEVFIDKLSRFLAASGAYSLPAAT